MTLLGCSERAAPATGSTIGLWLRPGFLSKRRQISLRQISIQAGKFLGNFSLLSQTSQVRATCRLATSSRLRLTLRESSKYTLPEKRPFSTHAHSTAPHSARERCVGLPLRHAHPMPAAERPTIRWRVNSLPQRNAPRLLAAHALLCCCTSPLPCDCEHARAHAR